MQMYFGDVSLCYSYSLAMALDSYGYDFKAEFLEAIMAMGNGASIVKEDDQHPLVFFDNGMPDLSISHSLKILGFDYEDFYLKGGAEVDLEEIKRKLETFLFNEPVVLGPLDMGHLTYNPNHTILYGVDHFVTVYDIDDQYLYLHDPAGFACMKVAFNDILEAWKAEAIDYKRGAYSMWGNFKRLKTPSQTEIYQETAKIMKNRYLNGQNDILECYAKAVVENGLNTEQKQLHQYFSFKLAAVRNLYLSKFLKDHDPEGARLKEELATLFGQAHLSCLKEDYQELAHLLYQIAEVDGRFRDLYVN
ncbi:peptidase [Streptococcus oralis]|uniref:peptidase n=1 Tax=Streptococcus oralis TaxID=1303 RepID=UPI000A100839|nr:peptidase [Streptococcus oralis]ORO66934.1 peptidase [Streptococcus oralis subsp. oralis]